MKKSIACAILIALVPFLSKAQEEEKPIVVETIQITVKPGANAAFEKAVKAHNEKYHPENTPHYSWLEAIVTGPNTGVYVWLMGPGSYADLDTRPAGEHDDEWNKNVMKHVESVSMIEYWSYMKKMSYRPENYESGKLDNIWFVDVKRGEFYRFKGVMEKVRAVQEKLNQPMGVWGNTFNAGDGRDVAIVWNMK
ncbi:MAG: hypothetical protein N4A46_00190, partial [Schleiferiaceae bacterium]|nr:hypothetical protein [Schleiferiaceae bacterium]